MERFETLVETVALEILGTTKVTYRGHDIDLKRPWRRVKLVDALTEHDVWSEDETELRAILEARGINTTEDKTWAQLVDHALTNYVEPKLIEPTFLHDYPVRLSPFARTTDADDGIVERFEGFVGGTELCNAFSELNDAVEQEERFRMQAEEGAGGNVEAEPGDEDYVQALSYGMAPTGGLGFGIDRLAMVLAGKESIRDVILFPAQRPRARRKLCVSSRISRRIRHRSTPDQGSTMATRRRKIVLAADNGGREVTECSNGLQRGLVRSWFSRRTKRGR